MELVTHTQVRSTGTLADFAIAIDAFTRTPDCSLALSTRVGGSAHALTL